MTIREAISSDADAIARLTRELGYAADPAAISQRLARLTDRNDQLVLVALLDEKPVGWLQAHASDVLESGFRVEIVGLIVSLQSRRLGIGRQLVQRAEQWAIALGAAAIVVRSNTARGESHRFYPALGFSATKTQAVYRKPLAK